MTDDQELHPAAQRSPAIRRALELGFRLNLEKGTEPRFYERLTAPDTETSENDEGRQ